MRTGLARVASIRPLVIGLAALASSIPFAGSAGAAGCKKGKLNELFADLKSTDAITKVYGSYNPRAQKGVMAILVAEGTGTPSPEVFDDILGIFQHKTVMDFNPLETDEGLFEAIADLTDHVGGEMSMREGLAKTIAELGNRGFGDDDGVELFKGAAFDLFMTRKTGPSNVASLQYRVDVPGSGGSRRRYMDIVEACPGDCGDLPGILHENKNWLSELGGPNDGRLVGLADQFSRDILIHNLTTFNHYRLNLRQVVEGQKDMIRDRLLAVFDDDPRVLAGLGGDTVRLQTLRSAFRQNWEAGDTLVRFY